MKKTLLAVCISFLSVAAFAQSLVVKTNQSDSVVFGNAYTSGDIVSEVNIQNVSSRPVDVLVKRIDKNYNSLTDSNAICWGGLCYSTSTSVAPMSSITVLKPGEETNPGDFTGHVYPDGDGVPHSGEIMYVFFDAYNPSDTVAHSVRYEVTTTFDVEEHKPERLLEIYPNPAMDEVNLRYDLRDYAEARFEVVNVVGNQVYAKDLNTQKSELRLDISKLARGVYFYTLRSDGKALLTRKLIVE